MNRTFKGIIITILVGSFFLLNSVFAHAANATFTISPSKGSIKAGNSFTVDVLIDTNSQSVLLARSVLTFDPNLLKVTKAEYNASLFCTYDNTKQSIDNTNGVIVLEGFCQSGDSVLYKTTGSPDVFARVTFETKKAGTASLAWEYTGSNTEFKSVIMQDGSPAFNILDKPAKATYTITTSGGGGVPQTGFFLSWSLITIGIICIISGIVYVNYMKKHRINGKLRTVVLDE
ncbi:MAG TPA: cohesin domain-containing protein [Candidatus Dojkabacteria bacterium]|nr:cohesin domain-containing protein [Candidatus Dojkabacteria bacterium]